MRTLRIFVSRKSIVFIVFAIVYGIVLGRAAESESESAGIGVSVGVGKFSSTPTPARGRSRLQDFFIISLLVKMETEIET